VLFHPTDIGECDSPPLSSASPPPYDSDDDIVGVAKDDASVDIGELLLDYEKWMVVWRERMKNVEAELCAVRS
jgi:hypothetical protein